MERQSLKSSSIRAAGYNELKQELEVEFLNGDLYLYYNVPLEVYVDFMDATSHGKYYVSHIRNNYDFKKVRDQLTSKEIKS